MFVPSSTTSPVACLTGASGFIGSRLAQRLVREGWQVHVILRPASDLKLLGDVASRLTLHRHDGTTEGLIAIVRDMRPTVCFHLASLFLASHKPADVAPLVTSNVLFATQLAEAMSTNPSPLMVNAGTIWQNYQSHPYSAVCLYAATKQACQDILRFYCETTPLRVVTLKLFDSYGPGDPRGKVLNLIRRIARSGEELGMTAGEQLIELVYVDDVVAAILRAAELVSDGGESYSEYSLGTGQPITVRQLVAAYARATGRTPRIKWGDRPYRPREMFTPWQSGRPLPGWRPTVSLDEGLRRFDSE